jgi:hypothetical protein
MSWLLLVASIVLEVLGTVSMKLSEGCVSPKTAMSLSTERAGVLLAAPALLLALIHRSAWNRYSRKFVARSQKSRTPHQSSSAIHRPVLC